MFKDEVKQNFDEIFESIENYDCSEDAKILMLLRLNKHLNDVKQEFNLK